MVVRKKILLIVLETRVVREAPAGNRVLQLCPEQINSRDTLIYLQRSDVPYFRWLVASFPQRLSGFKPESSHISFVMEKAELGQVFCE
jgi:hypothetical protein